MEMQVIQSKIYEIRGVRVMLDFDLAEMYEVPTKALKQAVRRNIQRFPQDFLLELTKEEWNELVTNCDQFPQVMKHSYVPPFAFTEHGVSMLASVLRSSIAVNVSIQIIRAFIAMREYLLARASESAELAKLRERVLALEHDSEDTLEAVNDLSEYTRTEVDNLYAAIGALSVKPVQAAHPRRKIGYVQQEE